TISRRKCALPTCSPQPPCALPNDRVRFGHGRNASDLADPARHWPLAFVAHRPGDPHGPTGEDSLYRLTLGGPVVRPSRTHALVDGAAHSKERQDMRSVTDSSSTRSVPVRLHAAETPAVAAESGESQPASLLPPLLVDVAGLAALLSRSVASLHRDDAAERLPAAVWIGGSKRWRVRDITAWVEQGCPSRAEFEARRNNLR